MEIEKMVMEDITNLAFAEIYTSNIKLIQLELAGSYMNCSAVSSYQDVHFIHSAMAT